MNGRYILNANGEPEPCEDLMTWGRWMSDATARIVASDYIGDVRVSTVFLGLDHAFEHGAPVLWETMIFGGPHDEYQDRYTSQADAKAGHARALELAQSAPAVESVVGHG
jgi:hypothetical protein